MSVDAMIGMGARLYDSPDNITFTEITDLQMIGSPDDPEAKEIDATPVNPTAGANEYLLGLLNYGEFEFKQYYNASRFVHHRGNLRQTVYYRIVLNDAISNSGSIIALQTLLKKCKISELEVEKVTVIECKAKITGPSGFTPAT